MVYHVLHGNSMDHANSNPEWIVCLVGNVLSKLRILKLIHVNISSIHKCI